MVNVRKVREQQEKQCLLLMVLRVHFCGKRRLDIVASAGFNTKTCSQSSDSGRIVKKSFRSNADNIAVKCRPTLSNWDIVNKYCQIATLPTNRDTLPSLWSVFRYIFFACFQRSILFRDSIHKAESVRARRPLVKAASRVHWSLSVYFQHE